MKRRWMQRLTAMGLISCMALWFSFPGKAADVVDLGKKCSLTVAPGSFAGEYLAEDLLKAHIVVDLYQVAELEENKTGGFTYDGYVYRLLEPYSDEDTGLQIGEEMTKDDWHEQTQRAARILFGMSGDGEPGELQDEPVNTAVVTSGDGVTAEGRIGDLDGGLYLLIARWGGDNDTVVEYGDLVKYLTVVQEGEDAYRIATTANSQECVYAFEPQLVSLPGKEPYRNADGTIIESNTANPGPWLYDMSVVLKSEVDFRYGSLEIEKNLAEFETSGPVTFVFEVVARWQDHINGEGADREWRDVVSMDFTRAESKFQLIEKLPVGAAVTVTEIYSGAAYQPEEEAGRDPFVRTAVIEKAEETFQVSFTNRYNERHTNGHGITNHFAYSEEEDRWIWTSAHADGMLGGDR